MEQLRTALLLYITRPIIALTLMMCALSSTSAAELRVFSGGAPQRALEMLTPEFERETGKRVALTFGLVTAIQQKLTTGEKADLILLPIPLIDATEKIVKLRPEGRVPLARVGIGVIVREGAVRPDISTPSAIRQLLLTARSITIPEASTPSGAHISQMLTQLGIADVVRSKLTVRAAIDGGAELVAMGQVEVGIYLLSEALAVKGLEQVGLLPASLQYYVAYGTAIPAYNSTPDDALAFIKFISRSSIGERWKAAGFDLKSE